MGTTKILTEERPDRSLNSDSIDSGEFPRLKSVSGTTRPVRLKGIGETQERKPPVSVWINVTLVIAQLLLLMTTVYLFNNLKQQAQAPENDATRNVSSRPQGQLDSESPAIIADLTSKKTSSRIAGFNHSDFMTDDGTPVRVAMTNGEQGPSIRLSIDKQTRLGREGGSLRIDYQKRKPGQPLSEIVFTVPNLRISNQTKLIFHLKTDKALTGENAFTIKLISDHGETQSYPVAGAFPFWKKYEIPLQNQANSKQPFHLHEIRIRLQPNPHNPAGTWFLDDLRFS